jgi:hypothetical protein
LFSDLKDGIVQLRRKELLCRERREVFGYPDLALAQLQKFDLLLVFAAAQNEAVDLR